MLVLDVSESLLVLPGARNAPHVDQNVDSRYHEHGPEGPRTQGPKHPNNRLVGFRALGPKCQQYYSIWAVKAYYLGLGPLGWGMRTTP